jgi:hypothetical protein
MIRSAEVGVGGGGAHDRGKPPVARNSLSRNFSTETAPRRCLISSSPTVRLKFYAPLSRTRLTFSSRDPEQWCRYLQTRRSRGRRCHSSLAFAVIHRDSFIYSKSVAGRKPSPPLSRVQCRRQATHL